MMQEHQCNTCMIVLLTQYHLYTTHTAGVQNCGSRRRDPGREPRGERLAGCYHNYYYYYY